MIYAVDPWSHTGTILYFISQHLFQNIAPPMSRWLPRSTKYKGLKMKNFFIIPIMDIDSSWVLRGFSHDFYAQEYCEHVLNIPAIYIDEATIGEDGLEIQLIPLDYIEEEDWYVNLERLDHYSHAS